MHFIAVINLQIAVRLFSVFVFVLSFVVFYALLAEFVRRELRCDLHYFSVSIIS